MSTSSLHNRRLNLTVVTAMTAMLVPLLTLSVADACQHQARYKPGKGHTTGNCNGQRVGPLTWVVRTSHPLVHRGQRHGSHLEVLLRGHAVKHVKRRPLNLALVLDRSGSMRGRKMADAKEAARRMIRLLEPGDVVSIVSYSDDVRVDWPARRFVHRDERRLFRTIDRLHAGGSTFLEGGMRAGADQVEKYLDDRRVSRVVLVSDGNANVGVRSGRALENIARRIATSGIATTTVGLGLDYNEDTMTAIADGGSGNYYYVKESEELRQTFTDELRAMMATAARRVLVRIRPRDGVRIRAIHGFDAERDGRDFIVPLPDLGENAERSVLVELSVPAHLRGTQRLADVQLQFSDMHGRRFDASSEMDYVVSPDRKAVQKARDYTVLKRVEEMRIAKALKDSAKLVEQGRGKEAQQKLEMAAESAARVQTKAKDKRLGAYLKQARSRAKAAPSAATGGRSSRENYKKANKAQAFSMSKY